MKNIFYSVVFLCLAFNFIGFQNAQAQESDDVIRLQCKGDMVKRTKNNDVAGVIFTFTLKDGKLYGREGELVENAIITDEEIKGKLKYRHGLSWENTRFQINRYTGAFNYHTIYRTLEKYTDSKNSGMCTKVENERKF